MYVCMYVCAKVAEEMTKAAVKKLESILMEQ